MLFLFHFPQVLFQQFKFFLNLYFLVITLTQFIPQLRIGYLYTYWGPLVRQCSSVVLWIHSGEGFGWGRGGGKERGVGGRRAEWEGEGEGSGKGREWGLRGKDRGVVGGGRGRGRGELGRGEGTL